MGAAGYDTTTACGLGVLCHCFACLWEKNMRDGFLHARKSTNSAIDIRSNTRVRHVFALRHTDVVSPAVKTKITHTDIQMVWWFSANRLLGFFLYFIEVYRRQGIAPKI